MPIYEYECQQCGAAMERYVPRFSSPNPDCCGVSMERVPSAFRVVWTGAITGSKYSDQKKENAHLDGHWAWKKKTASGNPEAVFIDTWQKQKEFCKSEGLVNPSEMPANPEFGSDGKSMSSRGMPGSWI